MTTARKTTNKAAAAKKTTAKKAPARRSKVVDLTIAGDKPFVAPLIMSSSLDLFADEDQTEEMVDAMREGLDVITSRAKNKQVAFLSPEQMLKTIIPLDEIGLQHALGSVGFRAKTMLELIAPEHVGKTTLIANWLGKFGLQGCQALYIECENKQMDPNRFLRCMHPDRKIASRVFKLVTFTAARTLLEAEHQMNVWAPEARARADKNPFFAGKPLIVVVDPWGKLMSSAEAEGYSDFGKSAAALKPGAKPPKAKKSAKVKETGQASNLGHAKYAHAWTRRLPAWLGKYNVFLIVVQHQNEHIDMGSFSPVSVSDQKNDTAIGGKAFAQLAAYRATLTSAGQWSLSDNTVIGNKLRLMFIKNSYGPKFRSMDLRLKFEHHDDTPTHFDPVTYYSYGTADWMVENSILNAKLSDRLYTCDTLGCVAVTADDLHTALKARPDVIKFIGTQQKIEGYAHIPIAACETPDEHPEAIAPPLPEVVPDLPAAAGPPPPPPMGDPPPPPPGNVMPFVQNLDSQCMTTPEDLRPDEVEGSIGGFAQ